MSTILLVDDEEPNRALIHAYLADSGLTIIDATSGAEALALAERSPPDLVLLDVLMPGLDGFEVTRRLKARPREVFLPVVLVTALTDQGSRRQGLLAGADDFLSKPVDPQELSVRVRNLLSLRDKERSLLEKNRELADLHRFKKEISALLVHDLKSPLAASLACIEYARETCGCGGDTREALEDAHHANRKLQVMLADLLDLERLENAQFVLASSTVDLHEWIVTTLAARRWEASHGNVSIEHRVPAGSTSHCDPALLARILDNLLDNALRYTPAGGRLVVEVRPQRVGWLQLRVGNTGDAIPPSSRLVVFEKYGQAQASGKMNYGFGLYFCKLAVEAHGGRISIEETAELPTVFVVELPTRDSLPPTDSSTVAGPVRRASRPFPRVTTIPPHEGA